MIVFIILIIINFEHSLFNIIFIEVPLWFQLQKPPTPTDPLEPLPYDRQMHLVNFWFDLFSSSENTRRNNLLEFSFDKTNESPRKQDEEEKLDYKTMVFLIFNES
jgi:hypothetical protein